MKACECTNEDSSGMIKDRDWESGKQHRSQSGGKTKETLVNQRKQKSMSNEPDKCFWKLSICKRCLGKDKKKNLRAEHRVSNLCSSEQSCALDLQSLSDHLNIENLEAATAAAAHPDELDSCSDLDVSNTPPGYSASATKATLQQPQPGQRHVSHQNKQKDFCDGLAYFWLIPLSCFYYST